MLDPFDEADERQANAVMVVDVPIELSLTPVDSALQNDIEVAVSVIGGTATGKVKYSPLPKCNNCV